MRINAYLAKATGNSRRHIDKLIQQGRVTLNDKEASVGMLIKEQDSIKIDGLRIDASTTNILIALNKPVGYVVSRNGQGAKTIYDLLPKNLHSLKPIGRLDKDSSGLLLLTNDGQLAQSLSHPSNQKTKTYQVTLDHKLKNEDKIKLKKGVKLADGLSYLKVKEMLQVNSKSLIIDMEEGRNRQIRRTFKALGYIVIGLHRISFGQYKLANLSSGKWRNESVK